MPNFRGSIWGLIHFRILETAYWVDERLIVLAAVNYSYTGLGYTRIRVHTGPRISVPQNPTERLTVCFVHSLVIWIHRISCIPDSKSLVPTQSVRYKSKLTVILNIATIRRIFSADFVLVLSKSPVLAILIVKKCHIVLLYQTRNVRSVFPFHSYLFFPFSFPLRIYVGDHKLLFFVDWLQSINQYWISIYRFFLFCCYALYE